MKEGGGVEIKKFPLFLSSFLLSDKEPRLPGYRQSTRQETYFDDGTLFYGAAELPVFILASLGALTSFIV